MRQLITSRQRVWLLTTGSRLYATWVCLGSGFSVVISVKEVNLSPLYSTVDHSHGNDNSAFGGDEAVIRQFCPYPVPLFYRLSSIVHQVGPTLLKPFHPRCIFHSLIDAHIEYTYMKSIACWYSTSILSVVI